MFTPLNHARSENFDVFNLMSPLLEEILQHSMRRLQLPAFTLCLRSGGSPPAVLVIAALGDFDTLELAPVILFICQVWMIWIETLI